MGGIFEADFQPVANPKTILLGDVSCGFAKKSGAHTPDFLCLPSNDRYLFAKTVIFRGSISDG